MSTPAQNADAIRPPSSAQQKLLERLTSEFTPFKRSTGFPFMIGNPTVHALLNRGFIEVLTVPPRWRITDAGRAALASAKGSAQP